MLFVLRGYLLVPFFFFILEAYISIFISPLVLNISINTSSFEREETNLTSEKQKHYSVF